MIGTPGEIAALVEPARERPGRPRDDEIGDCESADRPHDIKPDRDARRGVPDENRFDMREEYRGQCAGGDERGGESFHHWRASSERKSQA